MKRRLISMILCILTVLVLLPTAALAEENEPFAEPVEATEGIEEPTEEPAEEPEEVEEPAEEPEAIEESEPTEEPEEPEEPTEEPEASEEPEGDPAEGFYYYDDAQSISNEELFTQYVTDMFETGNTDPYADGISGQGTNGGVKPQDGTNVLPGVDANLTANEYKVEQYLKKQIKRIAAGERSSTIITIDRSLTKEEALRIYYTLRLDCNYELYWKGYAYNDNGERYSILWKDSYKQWHFCVAESYRKNGKIYEVNPEKVQTAQNALKNAKQIVAENAHRSDYYKLLAYYNKVASLSEYNYDYENCEYGDVWQLIYVFDGDPNTKVVCEGFAKAFEYLCNQSTFNGNVNAFCADGTVIWSNGSYGNHMWNVVRMDDGRNYLIDVTAYAGGEGTPVFLSYARGQISGLSLEKGCVTERDTVYCYYFLEQNANGSYDIKNSQTIPAVPAEYRVISASPYTQPDSAPVITKQPQNVISTDGSQKTISVEAIGGNLSYCWQVYRPGDKWRNYAEGTTALSVDPVGMDGWTFRCIVKNGKGRAISEKAVVLNANVTLNGVRRKGTTPFMVWTGSALKPSVTVKNGSGQTLSAKVSYRDNVNPGTAYADVTLTGSGVKFTVWFKIYLPPTASTQVSNAKNGIKVTWSAVPGAKGYVIYRKAWNASASGWTTFARWNNTTGTSWTDTKVYAGTRYVYAVKAYFSNPMDNYNLGLAGPEKEITRIVPKN